MIKSDYPLIEFNPKLPKLTQNQKKVLRLLIEAGKLIAPLYLEQEKQILENGNLYPKGVTKKEIEKAAQNNPEILSPYTVVEKTNGKLIAVPYYVKYINFLKPIADKLNQAAGLTENKDFSKFLKLKAKVLLNGNYEGAMIAWLKMNPPYFIDITIGPFEHHDDRIFFAKAPYQCWVGIIDKERTGKFNYYKGIVLSGRRKALLPDQKFENYKEVRAKIDDAILLSGHIARTKFVGINMPMNIEWVEKYGSEITLFNQVNNLRMQEQILPSLRKFFATAFKKEFSEEDLITGSISYVGLHELAHNDLYYRNAAKNLQDLFAPIYELTATVLGFKMAGSLLLKDVITNKQLESMVVAFICRNFWLKERSKKDKSWTNYALGGVIFNNFILQTGALKELKGLAIPNFVKIFVSIQDLFSALEYLLSQGTRKNAEAFIKKYSL